MSNTNIQTQIKLINYHFSGTKNSFLFNLHEHLDFNKEKFIELVNSIKILKKENVAPCDIEKIFIYNIFEKLTYMYDILRDLSAHPNSLNIGTDQYYEYILEIKYEILSLFNDNISIDFQGNKY